MNTEQNTKPDPRDSKYWLQMVKPYCGPETAKSIQQLSITLLIFFSLWTLCYLCLSMSYILCLIVSIPTAAFLVRLFMIQHDCGHGSYLKNRKWQDRVGFILGVMTITPYHYWKKTHAMHHSHSGNLDSNAEGEITTMTKEQYLNLSPFRQWCYRIYRHPLALFSLGPLFHFGLKHRFPWDTPKSWTAEWKSVWLTNLCLSLTLLLAHLTIGIIDFLMIQIPVSLLASGMGIFLFYVQHQFEGAYFRRSDDWNYFEAALQGSTHLHLPKALQWLTASIGLHHIHHLNHNIPNYKLALCHAENPELKSENVILLKDTPKLLKLSIWDEAKQRLISFREL
jgi:omega-6 fatty acid desaturase (delta-12 desaturase)